MVDIDIFLRDNYPFEQFTIIAYTVQRRAKNKPLGTSINGVFIFKNTHYLSFPTLFIYKKSML